MDPVLAETVKVGWGCRNKQEDGTLKKIAGMAAIIMALSTSFALAQSNPNLESYTGTSASEWARQHSVPGNPNNPSASDYGRR